MQIPTKPAKPLTTLEILKRAQVMRGERCPDCDCVKTESNGQRGRWAEYRCVDCDHRWGFEDGEAYGF